ncbi:MAG: S1C family serine protease [Chitinispirillaceae bacterium]
MNTLGRSSIYVLLLLVGLILGAVVGGEAIRRIYRRNNIEMQPAESDSRDSSGFASNLSERKPPISRPSTQQSITDSRRTAIVAATERVSSGVVGIIVTQLQYVGSLYYQRDFFNPFLPHRLVPQYKEVENMGSGFVIDEDGLILTNNHVVEGAQKLYVDLPDGKQLEGKVVGRDPYSDLALIKVDKKGLATLKIGDSEDLMIGEWVIAIGNPFLNFFNDPRPTVTVGVVSALRRNFAPSDKVYYQNMIQTDAAINPGNSGGPLLNAKGEVVGINTFIYTGSNNNRGSIGIGFAIPINSAKRVIDELLNHGHRRQIWTGITVQNLDRSVALAFGYDQSEGVLVTDVEKGSPGDICGLKEGDIIVQMGKRKIRNHMDIDGFFLNYFVEDRVKVTFIRNQKRYTAKMVLKEYPRS